MPKIKKIEETEDSFFSHPRVSNKNRILVKF